MVESAINNIKISIKEKRCVFFLGAGLSKEANLADADDICQVLKQDLNQYKESDDLQMLSQKYEVEHDTIRLKKVISKEIEKRQEQDNIDDTTYKMLAKLPYIDFVTTNWDTLLENQFKRTEVTTIFDNTGIFFWDNGGRNILKMHGSIISPSSIVVTRREYDDYGDSNSAIYEKLRLLLRDNVLVVIGYSMNDSNFRRLFSQIYKQTKNYNLKFPPTYWVEPFADMNVIDDWAQFDVKHLKMHARQFVCKLIPSTLKDVGDQIERKRVELGQIYAKIKNILKKLRLVDKDSVNDYEFYSNIFNELNSCIYKYVDKIKINMKDWSDNDIKGFIKNLEFLKILDVAIYDIFDKIKHQIHVSDPNLIIYLIENFIQGSTFSIDELNIELKRKIKKKEAKGLDISLEKDFSKDFKKYLPMLVKSDRKNEYNSLIKIVFLHSDELSKFFLINRKDLPNKQQVLEKLWEYFDIVLLYCFESSNYSIINAIKEYTL